MDTQTMDNYLRQAQMLANRTKKKFHHLRKRFARQNVDVFRLYDWDIPEIRAVVDWYGGHLVIGEYTRKQSTAQWLPIMGQAVAKALRVPMDKLHLKERFCGAGDGLRYKRLAHTNEFITVNEGDLKFYVNPWDYVDTGLFSDHRNTRRMVREMAQGKDFLNLFCYTGSFSIYAAKGGAKSSVSVDRSKTSISWAHQNMALNGIDEKAHQLRQAHAVAFLKKLYHSKQRFDLAVVDPPSFYTIRDKQDKFDIAQDHPELINAVVSVMRKGGTIFFSTNHQFFIPFFDELRVRQIREVTSKTIPEDYISKRKKIHRCWIISV